jgi:hypothetical protein
VRVIADEPFACINLDSSRHCIVMTKLSTLCLFGLFATACADDPVSYSDTVGINLKAESDKVNNNALADEKNINTESGNPYGAFVGDARNKLGHDPARIEIDKLTLLLGGSSTGVTTLAQVYTGDVDVLFVLDDSNNSYPVGRVTNPVGPGPVDVAVSWESDTVSDVDYAKVLSGGFKVVIRGTAATDFPTKGAKADLQLTFTFAAFE